MRIIDALRRKYGGSWTYDQKMQKWSNGEIEIEKRCLIMGYNEDDAEEVVYVKYPGGQTITEPGSLLEDRLLPKS